MLRRTLATASLAIAGSAIFEPFNGSALAEPLPADELIELKFPPIAALSDPVKYGYSPPDQAQIDKAKRMVQEAPSGPTGFAVAEYFVRKYYMSDPEAISQWPAPSAWNPLVVEFFRATTLHASNDMVDWCAAFVNWCLMRANKLRSNSAASQSFLNPKFNHVTEPQRGDLAIFTCYDATTNQSLGLGHVGFVEDGPDSTGAIVLIGGNTASAGRKSMICEKMFSTSERTGRRTVNGRLVPCKVRLSAYVRIP